MRDHKGGGDQTLNTIRAGRHELNRLLDAMDTKGANNTVDREFVRWGYRQQSVMLELRHPGGSVVRLPVATRNLSNSGIGVLHSSFVHTGTMCVVGLEHQAMGQVEIIGKVMRCQHVGGTVHEIGIRFEQAIDTREYISLDLLSEAFSLERVAPEKLQGTLVYVDDSDLDLKLVEKLLEPTFMSVRCTKSPEEGIELAQRGCDLVLCDMHMGETTGVDLIEGLRGAGVRAPVLMVTADTSQNAKDVLRSGGADALVSKPLTSEKLLRAIAEFMIGGADAGPLMSTLSSSDPSSALVEAFVEGIPGQIEAIEKAIREEDAEGCRQICLNLAGSARPLGFEPIGEVASRIHEKLGQGAGLTIVRGELQELLKNCKRTRNGFTGVTEEATAEENSADEDGSPEGETAQGESPATPEGETPEGESPERPEGEAPEGEAGEPKADAA